jgi:hypothetical protein
MGRSTYFHGMLEFTRPLSDRELGIVEGLTDEFRISDDRQGLIYASEKTYDMVREINSLIASAREKIPDFGIKGALAAETDFNPFSVSRDLDHCLWFVKIGPDGFAHGEKTNRDEWLAFRRKVYPRGYRGYGIVDPS